MYLKLHRYQNRTAWGISSIGRVRALQARGTGIETRILHFFCLLVLVFALVAQMVERKTLNLVVVGSSPTEGVFVAASATRRVSAEETVFYKSGGPMV